MIITNSSSSVLEYWFGNLPSEGYFPTDKAGKWFAYGDMAVKRNIQENFPDIVDYTRRGMFERWKETINGLLALIIVADQFPRHIFQGKAEAFQCDPIALRLCQWGLSRGMYKGYYPLEKVFFIQPLMHSEDIQLQEKSVEHHELLVAQSPASIALKISNLRNDAINHYEIIEAFGRFPQRNEILGRKSTPEELEYLAGLE